MICIKDWREWTKFTEAKTRETFNTAYILTFDTVFATVAHLAKTSFGKTIHQTSRLINTNVMLAISLFYLPHQNIWSFPNQRGIFKCSCKCLCLKCPPPLLYQSVILIVIPPIYIYIYIYIYIHFYCLTYIFFKTSTAALLTTPLFYLPY